MLNTRSFLVIATALLYTAGARAADQAPASSDTAKPERCLTLSAIRNMTVIDDKTLLFEMPGHKYYVNRLSHACPGIQLGDPIMYKTSLNLICNLDLVTVLDPIGGGFLRGPSCGLGMFVPITRAQAKDLITRRNKHDSTDQRQ